MACLALIGPSWGTPPKNGNASFQRLAGQKQAQDRWDAVLMGLIALFPARLLLRNCERHRAKSDENTPAGKSSSFAGGRCTSQMRLGAFQLTRPLRSHTIVPSRLEQKRRDKSSAPTEPRTAKNALVLGLLLSPHFSPRSSLLHTSPTCWDTVPASGTVWSPLPSPFP